MKKIFLTSIIALSISLFAFTLNTSQLFPTSLKITIRNDLGNAEEGVKVQLYKTDADYRQETNPVSEAEYSDSKGRVTFKDLDPMVYFVHAVKGNLNNNGAGVQTDTLKEGRINKVTIIIE